MLIKSAVQYLTNNSTSYNASGKAESDTTIANVVSGIMNGGINTGGGIDGLLGGLSKLGITDDMSLNGNGNLSYSNSTSAVGTVNISAGKDLLLEGSKINSGTINLDIANNIDRYGW